MDAQIQTAVPLERASPVATPGFHAFWVDVGKTADEYYAGFQEASRSVDPARARSGTWIGRDFEGQPNDIADFAGVLSVSRSRP
jgi:hypothetical protein